MPRAFTQGMVIPEDGDNEDCMDAFICKDWRHNVGQTSHNMGTFYTNFVSSSEFPLLWKSMLLKMLVTS